MKKKLTAFVLALCLVLVLVGCSSTAINSEIRYNSITETKSLHKTQYSGIYYDADTCIAFVVYFIGDYRLMPYYAPNGLPYLYDVESGELVEIEK